MSYDEKELAKFEAQLMRPPPGIERTPEMKAEQGKQFMQFMHGVSQFDQ